MGESPTVFSGVTPRLGVFLIERPSRATMLEFSPFQLDTVNFAGALDSLRKTFLSAPPVAKILADAMAA
jgi:hypothetical protein